MLGGRKLQVRRPRARTVADCELALRTYAHFAAHDLLRERTVETMLDGLSARRHRAVLEPTGTVDRSVSKSAVSRRVVARTRKALAELLARPVPDDIVVLMLDGVVLAGHTCLCALAIRADGTKVPLGLWEGASENAAVCRRALADLGERGLTAERGLLICIDGSKALRKAVSEALGEKAAVQRCRRQQENGLGHLPEAERLWVRRKLREAWSLDDADHAERRLRELARALEPKRPRCRGQRARRPSRDGHHHPVRNLEPAGARADARDHEPDRFDALGLPRARPQRQALALRRDGPALDGCRHARRRAPLPTCEGLPRAAEAAGSASASRRRHRPEGGEDFPIAA